jgi:hypothetical protein
MYSLIDCREYTRALLSVRNVTHQDNRDTCALRSFCLCVR